MRRSILGLFEKNVLDAHNHLADEVFDSDRSEVISRAVAAGVDRFLCCGTSEIDWAAVRTLAESHGRVIPAFGLHPWFVAERSPEWKDTLRDFVKGSPSIIGEIGLDGVRRDAAEEMTDVFVEQLNLAAELSLPVSIHCVRAWEPLLEVVRPFGGRIPVMIHGFGGSVEVMKRLEDRGCFISFGCAVLDPSRRRIRAAAAEVRLDRILLETDAPDMPPAKAFRPSWMQVGDDGTARNEPAMIPAVLDAVAELKRLRRELLAEAVEENGRRFLRAYDSLRSIHPHAR